VPEPPGRTARLPEQAVNSTISVIRPSDHLVLVLEFRGVDFTPPAGNQPGEVRGAANAFLILRFQPQHIHEQAFFQPGADLPPASPKDASDTNPDPPLPPGLVQSRLSGPSQLAFTVPPGEKFPYTLEGLLAALERLPLSVSPVSAYNPELTGCLPLDLLRRAFSSPQPPHVAPPGPTHTAIEIPYRLILSPDDFAIWSHASKPVTHADWTELWHTRLASRRNADPRVRAIWSPDFIAKGLQTHYVPGSPTSADPFRASLDARDRNEIVHLTSNHYIDDYIPSPVETEQFTLTSLGATVKFEGAWDAPESPSTSFPATLTVEQWRHEASIGRDQFVKVVYRGFLVPFGHRASVVKITERRFYPAPAGQPPGFIAYLFQRIFIIVRDPLRTYEPRSMPFRSVRIKTTVTPNLDDPAKHHFVGTLGLSAFWPYVEAPGGGFKPFHFQVVATDWSGTTSEFGVPMAFVDLNVNNSQPGAVVSSYNGVSADLRYAALGGQGVTFAPSKTKGDTILETNDVTFGTDPRSGDGPRFQPKVDEADVVIPAVKQATGGPGTATIKWEPSYLANAGDTIGNVANVFARVSNGALNFGSTERSGGLVAPDLSISGLSRSLGPIGGPVGDMVGGKFDPAAIFGTVKLLGGLTLGDIIDTLKVTDAFVGANKIPKLVTERKTDRVITRYDWVLSRSELRPVDPGLATLWRPTNATTFQLKATVEKKLDTTTPPAAKVEGKLTEFAVRLISPSAELVELRFKSVSFVAEPNKKVDVSIDLKGFEFLGILAFVNRLQEFIPLDGFTDPPNLRLVQSPSPGVELGFSMGIPTIGIGIMTMQNVSLAATVYLPFGDNPLNFRFAFCERQQPFTLTVSLFGGGGFFAMETGVDKVVMVEAALEFGASVALNLGVAKGQASIMAGFYFQKAGEGFTLTGYFRASGSLSVIGIITVSLVFYLGLSYASKGAPEHGGALWGQAKLTVKIEILFFSTSVSVSMEREFAGSDPTFRELISPGAWTQYCNAFAEYA
jgi:hypothetical protein